VPSAGNGTAMRAAPVGLVHLGDPYRIYRDSLLQSVITSSPRGDSLLCPARRRREPMYHTELLSRHDVLRDARPLRRGGGCRGTRPGVHLWRPAAPGQLPRKPRGGPADLGPAYWRICFRPRPLVNSSPPRQCNSRRRTGGESGQSEEARGGPWNSNGTTRRRLQTVGRELREYGER